MSKEALQYGEFLRGQREQRNIELEPLSEGLYTVSMLGRIEKGERYPEKLMRDRLIARLGETGYDFECYLQPEEYAEWEERRDILDALDDRELECAAQLLEQYKENNDMELKLNKQFYLVMRMEWLRLSGASYEEWSALLEEAVKLTIPNVDTKPALELLLSVQEWNLLLEYITYKQAEGLEELYVELFQYVEEQSRFDLESKALLCSKIALYYSKLAEYKMDSLTAVYEKMQLMKKTVAICNYGIECLRNHCKAYFAWELFQKKEKCLQYLLENKTLISEAETQEYEQELSLTREFYSLFDKLYETYQVPKETSFFTVFYREHEIYCISDVIRARRKMFGYSKSDLEDICGESTIKRIEKGKTKTQIAIVQRLFERFHLSMGLHRAQIVTEKQEALWLEKQFRVAYNHREYETAKEVLEKLKQMISMEELINKQYIEFEEFKILCKNRNIAEEEYIHRAIEYLEYTVPLNAAMEEIRDVRLSNGRIRKGEKYLTNTEVTILHNIAVKQKGENCNQYWKVLHEYFDVLERKCTIPPILGMYGFVMASIASAEGNRGNYDISNSINRRIVKESLRVRNTAYLHSNMYGLLWNDRMQKGLPLRVEDPVWKQGLLDCLTINIYNKNKYREDRMRQRLEMK